jgi:hypothetical protein
MWQAFNKSIKGGYAGTMVLSLFASIEDPKRLSCLPFFEAAQRFKILGIPWFNSSAFLGRKWEDAMRHVSPGTLKIED